MLEVVALKKNKSTLIFKVDFTEHLKLYLGLDTLLLLICGVLDVY